MAIADYFERSVNAASQILKDFDYDAFVRLLDRHRIGLMIDGAATKNAEGHASADLAVRLLARFYPKVAIVAADAQASAGAKALRELALAINPKINITDKLAGATHCLVVGKTAATLKGTGARVIYIGSSNWTARLSMKKPVGSGASKNPFAAGVAACLGVANIFRAVFAKQLPGAQLDDEVTFSLLTLAKGAESAGAYKAPDIGKAFLVGAGAIGNGVLWAIGQSGVTGQLGVVEPQQLDLSNMQRYVMPVMDDVERSKTTLAEKWLGAAVGLKVVPHKQKWEEFVRSLKDDDWKFERVLVALDSAEARIGVQASLPKWVANAYTQISEIGVSRHHFLSQGACLACVYIPREQVASEDVLVASALGFATTPPHPEIMEIRRRLDRDRNELCDRAFLEIIATKKGIPVERLLPFENRPLRSLYQQGVCGGQVIGITVDGKEVRAEVPMAFQSAMAGILLAAELVLDASGTRDASFPTVTRFNLHRPMPDVSTSVVRGKDSEGRCLCQDEDYQRAYAEKYGVALPPAATNGTTY